MSAPEAPRAISFFPIHRQDHHLTFRLSPHPSTNAMVAPPIKPHARDDSNDGRNGNWGTLQIATPAIVGGVLLFLFVAYIIWQRRPHDKRPYDYHKVRSDWATKIERMFVPQRKRVLHSSAPMTLDDSMCSSELTFDYRRSQPDRSDSSDSQTPLTSTSYAFGYPPKTCSDSPPPTPKHRAVRWWWILGSRPQEIKSEEPGKRWCVDDPDESSTGHGHSTNDHRYTGALGSLHEDPEEVEDGVIPIGENFDSIESTSMTRHFPEQARSVRGMLTVPEKPWSSDARIPASVPAAGAPQSNPRTPLTSSNRGLPPSYDISGGHTRYPSTEDITLARYGPYMPIPPPALKPGYPSPRTFHGRELSSDSFLATQPPMVATFMY
ncbi:hypothetical protein HD554DRAFT_2143114 [Boletus coccyginus]|nr:hypothetical protein HD554DRAFT_2143114 [Boletus coccyginus]